jgi:fructose-specific phosphotransferase system component IIB
VWTEGVGLTLRVVDVVVEDVKFAIWVEGNGIVGVVDRIDLRGLEGVEVTIVVTGREVEMTHPM